MSKWDSIIDITRKFIIHNSVDVIGTTAKFLPAFVFAKTQ